MQAREQRALADAAVVDHRHKPAALADLLEQRGRHGRDRAHQQDHVERRLARMPGGRIVAGHDHHVVDRELLEQGLDRLDRHRSGLQQDHGRRHARQHHARIAGRAADHQHHVLRADLGGLDQARQHQRLDQVAAGRQQQVLVGIGDAAQQLGQEALARHLTHRIEQARILDPVRTQLVLDHVDPSAGLIHRQVSLAGRGEEAIASPSRSRTPMPIENSIRRSGL
jgi:hypothetical protein